MLIIEHFRVKIHSCTRIFEILNDLSLDTVYDTRSKYPKFSKSVHVM